MAYTFRGFFIRVAENDEQQPIQDVLHQHLPHARFRAIAEPFSGIAVQLPDEAKTIFREEQLFVSEGPPLLRWSQQFPGICLLYLETECFAGMCNYWGYVCCKGHSLHSEAADVDGETPLIRLLHQFGVESSGYFAALERGFFGESGTA